MASVTSFIRNTPTGTLNAYFEQTAIGLSPRVDWRATEPSIVLKLLRALEGMAAADRARVVKDIDRVAAIADEPGQVALYSVTKIAHSSMNCAMRMIERYGCLSTNRMHFSVRRRSVLLTSVAAGECGMDLFALLISSFTATGLPWMLLNRASVNVSKPEMSR